MHSTLTVASALAVLAGQTLAKTFDIKTNGLAFSPSSVSDAKEGDEIRVTFSKSIPHGIQSSTFDNPCTYNEAGGLASIIYSKGEVFVFSVKSADPQLFFCPTSGHCNSGMVFAINPSGSNTVEAAQSKAADADTKPANVQASVGGSVEGEGGDSKGNPQVNDDTTSSAAAPASTVASASSSMAAAPASTMPEASSSSESPDEYSTSSVTAPAAATSMTATASSAPSGSTAAGEAPATQTTNAAAAVGGSVAMAGALLAGVAAFAL